ncbi:hypothetical protein SS50377_28376 [Spironucleus salmonicida]|uniref:Uncharacterized protein n=1 Tax=Spironucleus salmonicida TaxID=348837 RepID=A0A9P8LJZ4_9EUKA|nr:hypothetical protein SS50377_28376 [Spironucleus salmonicida]
MYPLEFQPGKANSCLSDMYCAANIPSDFSCSSCKDLTFPRQISCSCKDETRLLNCKACENRARINCFNKLFVYQIQLPQSKAFTPFQEAYYKKTTLSHYSAQRQTQKQVQSQTGKQSLKLTAPESSFAMHILLHFSQKLMNSNNTDPQMPPTTSENRLRR